MDRIWHGRAFVKPFLALGATRNILVPRTGRDVPFTIENVPYTDGHGRETVTFVRTFALPSGPRRFDATMVHSPERSCVLDYLGTHQHLATDLRLTAEPDGSLLIRSGEHRFREGPVDLRVPRLVGGDAEVRESFDDATGRFRIRVAVTNRRFGPLFGYEERSAPAMSTPCATAYGRACARSAKRRGRDGERGGGGHPDEAAGGRAAHPRRTGDRQDVGPLGGGLGRGQPGAGLLSLRLGRRAAGGGLPATARSNGWPATATGSPP